MQSPRYRQGEAGDGGVELYAVVGTQGVNALHGADRGFNHRPAGVGKGFPGPQIRLFADHPFPADFLYLAVGVGDQPVPAQQFSRDIAVIGDGDSVGKHITALLRR